jgi:DNA-binding PadR family transcriptional regulator
MTAVFSHGRLRLYLLKLLSEGPKHGYELIRLLENRFLGLYAPSAGTIYPRLSRMETEGLVTHTAAGGRKVYEITAAGRAELADRAGELADLEREIHASVADLSTLAGDIERQVSGSVRDIKRELREAAKAARSGGGQPWTPNRPPRQPWRSSWESASPPASGGSTAPGANAASAAGGSGGPATVGESTGSSETFGGTEAGRSDLPGRSDLLGAAAELAGEVARLARKHGVTDSQIQAATAVVGNALTELRRLLTDRSER